MQAITVIVTGVAVWWLSFASDEQKANVEETLSPLTNAITSLVHTLRNRIYGKFTLSPPRSVVPYTIELYRWYSTVKPPMFASASLPPFTILCTRLFVRLFLVLTTCHWTSVVTLGSICKPEPTRGA